MNLNHLKVTTQQRQMEKQEFTIEKSNVECYKIRHPKTGMYWADITIDSMGSKGRISISSDYGNYANFWGACGKGGFKNFLTEINMHYAADKFGADRWFDIDSTIEGYKKRVLEYRRDETIESEKAREIFDEIKELESCSGEGEFVGQMWNSPNLMRFFDFCPEMERNVTPQFRKFWETIWPVFIDQLNKEIEVMV